MSGLFYVTKDYRNMLEDDLKVATVRSGPINYEKIFHHIYGDQSNPTPRDLELLKKAYRKIRPKLSRCQSELMIVEFGLNEVRLMEMPSVSDALTKYPPESNERKLEDALELLHRVNITTVS